MVAPLSRFVLPPTAGLCLLAAWLAGCTGGPTGQQPFGYTLAPACPAPQLMQANRLGASLMRLRLGMDKLQVAGILGAPAHAETFALLNGQAVEVFFYHTAETICRKSALDPALMPLVFQNDKLLGYGQGYYHNFIVPLLRTALSNVPEESRFGTAAIPGAKVQVPLEPAPSLPPLPTSNAPALREDLLTPLAPAWQQGGSRERDVGYSGPYNQLGAGEPLR